MNSVGPYEAIALYKSVLCIFVCVCVCLYICTYIDRYSCAHSIYVQYISRKSMYKFESESAINDLYFFFINQTFLSWIKLIFSIEYNWIDLHTRAHRFLNLPDDLFPCQVGTGIAGRQETSSHLAHPPHRQDVHCSRYHATGIVFSYQKLTISPFHILDCFSIDRLSGISLKFRTKYLKSKLDISCYSTIQPNSKEFLNDIRV